MNSGKSRLLLFLSIIALPVFLVGIPIGNFFVMSFWQVTDGQIVASATLENYVKFLSNRAYWGTFLFTIWLCLKVAGIGVLIGYPVSYFIWRLNGRLKYTLLLLLILPLFMSYIVKIYTMRSILGLNGFLNQILISTGILESPSLLFLYNRTAILITMAVIFLPFVILPIFLALERIPQNLINASADLGASAFFTFRRVIVPLTLPGTIAGALFTFVLALGDFVTPQMVGGPNGFTFGRVIWSQFGLAYDWPFGAALAVILFCFALTIILMAGFATRKQRI